MSTDLLLVFDTNVLISGALFAHGKPGQALRWALRQGQLLVSPSTLAEISEVIGRTKFERYLTAAERDEFLAALAARAILVEPTETIQACRDPKDDQFLELAVGGGADYLVTGDADLLVLNPFRGVKVLTPAQFLILVRHQTTCGTDASHPAGLDFQASERFGVAILDPDEFLNRLGESPWES